MATYFHGAPPEMQPDGLQTLYLMNPSYVGYADAAAPANMVFLNSVNSPNAISLAQQQQQQHFVGIPLQPPAQPHDSARPPIHDASAVQGLLPRLHYNLWTPPTTSSNPVDVASQFAHRRGATAAAVGSSAQQGLSLSLSPHEMVAPAPEMPPASTDEVKIAGVSNGASGLQSLLMGSKFLKAAQQLLDEVVNVGKEIKEEPAKGASSKNPADSGNMESKGTGTATAEETNGNAKRGADLTTAERQELQMKKAKLINMLEEVEQRYRQYHHQMQIVVSSFEAVAGYGSARTYTALALRTISKQFRCLRDAITGQIRATSKCLGDEDAKSGGSRLRFIDHHLRQQRALQQLGMIQQNAWRPQRGLPERSVSILRAWLFEHFLHPYPKDSDKIMLAKQTGLTRSQVSNWFINARVRLWKPMVEEMYTEEIKDQEQNNSEENESKITDAHGSSASKSYAQQENSPTATDAKQTLAATVAPSSFVHSQNQTFFDTPEFAAQSRIKKARSNDSVLQVNSIGFDARPPDEAARQEEILMKLVDGRQRAGGEQGYPLMAGATSHGGSFGAYSIEELGRFDGEQFAPRFSNNGVSLTLGLQHNENLSFLSNESIQLGRRMEMGGEASDFCSLGNSAGVAHPSSNAAFRAERGLLLNYYQTS
ncbi:hypothetical protein Cni_G19974 [Canna indica]|uniref:Homeobox domain-containing protein n=1 Tax=Canna indica TaxID=4628 RepID=A0AAQ3KP56_9LILI|nr:hypothetical protein Cni_G19974 [Canna indica]